MAKFSACWNQGLEIGMLFYDMSLEKRVVFQFCGMSHTPSRHFPEVSKGAYRIMWAS